MTYDQLFRMACADLGINPEYTDRLVAMRDINEEVERQADAQIAVDLLFDQESENYDPVTDDKGVQDALVIIEADLEEAGYLSDDAPLAANGAGPNTNPKLPGTPRTGPSHSHGWPNWVPSQPQLPAPAAEKPKDPTFLPQPKVHHDVWKDRK